MSTEEEQQYQYYAYPNEQNSSCQYNAAYMNYRPANASDELMYRTMPEHAMYWGMRGQYPQQQQQHPSSATVPVYGPSEAPRLHQFVDFATNSSGMTPFFALAGDNCSEDAMPQGARKLDPPVFNTPQQKHRSTAQHTVTPSSSSMMGMSISPASTMDRTAALRTAAGSLAATPAIRVETRTRQTAVQFTPIPTKATPSGAPPSSSAAAAADGQRSKKSQPHALQDGTEEKPRRRQDERGKEKTTTATPAQGRCPSTERKQRSRRNKETTRQSKKSKNNTATTQQQKSQCHGNNNTSRSLLEILAAHAHADGQEECQRFLVTLRCRGDHTASVFSYFSIPIGTHAIFEGDRGNDLGEVLSCEETTEMGADGKKGPQLIVRNATDEEVEDWNGTLAAEEAEAAGECRSACEELGLTITVVGAVFQFDRQKLTFLYESDARVDFRTLLQVMFSKYHCRIWMERVSQTSE